MAPVYAAATLWAGVGLAIPAAAGFAIREGFGAGAGAAALSAALLLLLAGGWRPAAELPRRPLPLLALPAGAILGVAALQPLLGLRLTALAGAALAAAGWGLSSRTPPEHQDAPSPPSWLLALVGAAAAAWARCLGLLWGNSLSGLCVMAAASAAGLALGLWLRARMLPLLADWPRRGLVAASALAGLAGLCWLRFIGFNAGAPEYLIAPLQGPEDLAFIVGQSALASGLWCAVLALAWEPAEPAPTGRLRSLGRAALAAAGPLAAWALGPRLGPAETAAAAHLALAAAACLSRAPGALPDRPIFSKVAAAALALGLVMGWQSRRLLSDIWLYRLDAALAGGQYLALRDDGREVLGAYRFSSGVCALLRDGGAWVQSALEAKREVHLPLLLQGSPQSILLLNVRSPVAVASAMAYGVKVVSVDPHPAAGEVLAAQAAALRDTPGGKTPILPEEAASWPPASPAVNGATISWVRADLRRSLRASGPAFDAILEDLPFPATAPEHARLVTQEAFRELRARLTPAGVAALRLPAPYPPHRLSRALRTARSVFAHVGGYELPAGYLLVCSDRPLAPAGILARFKNSVWLQADDLDLEEGLQDLRWDDMDSLPPDAAALAPDTDDRPSGFYPLPYLARRIPLVYTAAEAVAE
ncbi:MAG: hypothetical protein HY926_00075 [Elusimicrobia bacterium]|nr:hypothetical protein [Elusimicrobiota bacterium]